MREDDILTRDERDADRYLFFLTGKRKTKNPFAAVDLQRLCDRVESFVTPRVARLTMPYLRERPRSRSATGTSSGARSRTTSARSSASSRMRARTPSCAAACASATRRTRWWRSS